MSDAPGPPSTDARQRRLMQDLGTLQRTSESSTPSSLPPLITPESERNQANDADTRRERLHRVLARLNRLHEPASSTTSYSDRIPPPTQQSLYDWAPAHEEGGDDEEELEEILRELRRQQPGTHPEILRVLGRSQLDREREVEQEGRMRWRRQMLNETANLERRAESLRSTAIMQNARNLRSPSGTERLLRYIRDREQTGQQSATEQQESSEERQRRATARYSRAANSLEQSARLLTESTRLLHEGSRYELNRLSWRQQHNLEPSRTEAAAREERELRARIDGYRRGYLAENPSADRRSTSSSTALLENAVKYLDRLRSCWSYEDALSAAIDHGLATKEFFADKHDDFPMDLSQHPPPPPSSWLQPGVILKGSQHTTSLAPSHDSSATTFRPLGPPGTFNAPDASRPPVFDATRPWLSHTFRPPSHPALAPNIQDHWPVKVTIHAIDSEKMTLAGTMEAYDVPNHTNSISSILSSSSPRNHTLPPLIPSTGTSTKKHAPITTYLEGHILDLCTHSFLTPSTRSSKSHSAPASAVSPTDSSRSRSAQTDASTEIHFPLATPATDAANWRKLPPFNALGSDDEVARVLLSSSRMAEVNNEYIFMRWKERCFIHAKSDPCPSHGGSGGAVGLGEGDDTDTGHGLTISGFYYVSLRRADGCVEGLYYDPTSSPYQCLRLEGKCGGRVGAWDFS